MDRKLPLVPFLALLAAILAGAATPGQAQVCAVTFQPVPSEPLGRPLDDFNFPGDYNTVHSSTHLQGTPAREKWGWAFYEPPGDFAGFRTAVVVNNPSPTASVKVRIEYRDTQGNLLPPSTTVTIAPQCYYSEQALPIAAGGGFGSVRVVATNDGSFVGAVVHHSYSFAGVPDHEDAGLASMEQLQVVQPAATRIYGGPFPVTTVLGGVPLDPYAFNVGNLPIFQVVNPNNAVNHLLVTLSSPQSGVFSSSNVTLPPYGSYIDFTLYNIVVQSYTAVPRPAVDFDVIATIASVDGLPILGEQIMMSFFDRFMSVGVYFRMGSAMLASTPSLTALNPELTFTTAGPPVETLMAIANVSSQDIGPVRIEYRDRNGGIATDVLASFPSGATQRIAPGQPGIDNYPSVAWDHTARIVACRPGLIGWTMRQVEPNPSGGSQLHKVYGESLDHTTGSEPGAGVTVTTLGRTLVRKVSPIERIASPDVGLSWWPHYNAIANYSAVAANTGNYWFRSFRQGPAGNCLESTHFPPQPFAGLPWGLPSFTFKDGTAPPLAMPPSLENHMGTVDHQSGSIIGIDVIGDPLYEWSLGFPQEANASELEAGDGPFPPQIPQP